MDMTKEDAHAVYDILVEECGALEDERERFVRYHAKLDPDSSPTEWRFQGDLGFGGKFWRNNGRWYVNCYPESRNDERNEMIHKANERLHKIYESGYA